MKVLYHQKGISSKNNLARLNPLKHDYCTRLVVSSCLDLSVAFRSIIIRSERDRCFQFNLVKFHS